MIQQDKKNIDKWLENKRENLKVMEELFIEEEKHWQDISAAIAAMRSILKLK